MVCPVFSRVVSFRHVEGPNRTLVSKTSATCSHHGRRSVFRARAVEQLEMVHKQHLATNKAFLDGYIFQMNSLWGSKLAFPGNYNSLRGNKLSFPGNNNSLRGNKLAFPGNNNSLRGNDEFALSGNMKLLLGVDTVLREKINFDVKLKTIHGSLTTVNSENGFVGCLAEHEATDLNSLLSTDIHLNPLPYLSSDDEVLIYCDENTPNNKNCDKFVNHETCANIRACRSHVRVMCRVRDREPSRVALKRVIKSLKMRKSRAKCKHSIQKSVPVSSVLYSIASNYKQWKIKFAKKQDNFFSNYFEKSVIHTVKYNASKRNILLSGDIELNPGPTTPNVSSLQMLCKERPNSVFNCRLHRYGLRALEVGGMGNCLVRAVAHQIYCTVIQIVI